MRRWVLLAATITVAIAAMLLVRDVQRAERALTTAREQVEQAREQLGRGDVGEARAGLGEATTAVATARASVDGPLWAAAAVLPAVGDPPRTVRRLVDLAGTAVDLASATLEAGGPVLGDDGELAVSFEGGRADLGPVRELGDVLAALPVSELRAARDRLAGTGTTLLPERLAQARDDVLELADEMTDLLDVAGHVTAVLPPFLGSESTREYLLALQNPAEVRGTGGLIGLIAVARFEDGAFSLVPPSELQEADRRLEDTDLANARADEDYLARYGRRGGASLLQNLNLDPDLPTVAPVLLDLWERRIGDPPDGVIALDPVLLADIVRTTGPVPLPEAFTQDPRIPAELGADELLRVVSVEAYEVFGGDSPERKAFLEAVSTAVLSRLTAGATDTSALARVLASATAERHLQLYSTRDEEEQHFRALGIGGGLAPRAAAGDLLAVTANNAGGNKQDVHVGHALTWDVRLEDLAVGSDTTVTATRRTTLSVLVENPLPADGMHPWIVGSAEPGRGFEGLQGPPGLNRTWFTLWLPPGAEVLAGRGPDGAVAAQVDTIHGQQAVDVFLDTPSMTRRSFDLETRSPTTLSVVGDHLRWEATLWRQGKAIPDDVDLALHPPVGWVIADATLAGGGDGDRPDLSVDPRPGQPVRPRLDVEPDLVTVRGQLTADAHLTVNLTPAPSNDRDQ